MSIQAQSEEFNEEWRWVHFTTESGLPSDHIYEIVETSDGTPWVATSKGLAWYDGFRWHAVPDSLGIPIALDASMDGCLTPHGKDKVFANFYEGLYDVSQNSVQKIRLNFNQKKLNNGFITSAGDLGCFVQVYDELFRYDSSRISSLKTPARLVPNWRSVFYTRNRSVWINTTEGIYRWTGNQWVEKFKFQNEIGKVNTIIEDKNGVAFISLGGLNCAGLWKIGKHGAPIRPLTEGKNQIQTMDVSPMGEIITVHRSGHIRIRDGGKWHSLHPIPAQMHNILYIKFRDNGDLWVCSEKGLFLYKKNSKRWSSSVPQSVNNEFSVNELLHARDGSIWLGTSQGIEIHRLDGSVHGIHSLNGHPIEVVTGLAEDDSGGIWISSGSAFDGVYHWDGFKWHYFKTLDNVGGVKIHKIRKDRHGRMWFLGISKKITPNDSSVYPGAFVYSERKFVRWGTSKGMLNGKIYAFTQTDDGSYWFGTSEGLCRWKPLDRNQPDLGGTWTYWNNSQEIDHAFALDVGSTGLVWFANRFRKIGYIDELDNVQFPPALKYFRNSVWDIKFDVKGRLWIAVQGDGIGLYHNGVFSQFGLSSGLSSPKVWPLLPVDDRLYIGTDGNGVNILNLEEAKNPLPRIELHQPSFEGDHCLISWETFPYWGEQPEKEISTRYKLDDRSWTELSTQHEVRFSDLSSGDHTFQVQAKSLFGNYDSLGQHVAFTITPPLYKRPIFALPMTMLVGTVLYLGVTLLKRKRKHALALRESEAKFRTVTETTASAIFIFDTTRIIYSNPEAELLTGYTGQELSELTIQDIIHPEYRFEFESTRNPVNEKVIGRSSHECMIRTKVGNERWIYYTTGPIKYKEKQALLVTAFDITAMKKAEQRLIDYQHQLQSLTSEMSLIEEKERRHMATYLHDYISQTLALCKIKLDSVPDNAKERQLTEINNLLEQMIQNTQELTFELSPPVLYELDFEDALKWLTEQMTHQHNMVISFKDDIEPIPIRQELRTLLFTAVRELLVNIVKHAKAIQVKVFLRVTKETIVITVEDDGVGFSLTSINNGQKKKGGFGLFNIRERLKYFGGEIEINSQHRQGTKIILTVPLNHSGDVSKELLYEHKNSPRR